MLSLRRLANTEASLKRSSFTLLTLIRVSWSEILHFEFVKCRKRKYWAYAEGNILPDRNFIQELSFSL